MSNIEQSFAIKIGDNKFIIIPKHFIFGINFIICFTGLGLYFKFFPPYAKEISEVQMPQIIKNILIIIPPVILFSLLFVIGAYLITIIYLIIKGKIKHQDI